ncbi:hypothetical protein OAU11_00730 [Flavobacteriaceae bacterium]|nr:hypothetical protein [Flavobacteriaceae bacterium]
MFKLLFTSVVKKAASQQQAKPSQSSAKPKQDKTLSDSLGDYIDYEEVE